MINSETKASLIEQLKVQSEIIAVQKDSIATLKHALHYYKVNSNTTEAVLVKLCNSRWERFKFLITGRYPRTE
jgi:hypothetical protein